MLEKDLADNKAIGMAGCNLILNTAVSNSGGGDGTVRVLTHCNTGSLATAGYGTALGVIRALHASRRLGKNGSDVHISDTVNGVCWFVCLTRCRNFLMSRARLLHGNETV